MGRGMEVGKKEPKNKLEIGSNRKVGLEIKHGAILGDLKLGFGAGSKARPEPLDPLDPRLTWSLIRCPESVIKSLTVGTRTLHNIRGHTIETSS